MCGVNLPCTIGIVVVATLMRPASPINPAMMSSQRRFARVEGRDGANFRVHVQIVVEEP